MSNEFFEKKEVQSVRQVDLEPEPLFTLLHNGRHINRKGKVRKDKIKKVGEGKKRG